MNESKIGSPPTTTSQVNSRLIKDQYLKAETMGLIEVSVGEYLSDLGSRELLKLNLKSMKVLEYFFLTLVFQSSPTLDLPFSIAKRSSFV